MSDLIKNKFNLKNVVKNLSLGDFIKKHIKLIVLAVLLGVVFLGPLREFISLSEFRDILESKRDMPYAPLMFVLFYTIGVVFALPGLAFMILGGSMFGFWKGLMLVIIASNIGCQITFFISRVMGRDFMSRFFKLNGFLNKVSDKLDRKGFMVILYLRLIPLFPFNLVNYASGLTNINHKDYTLGTFFGKLPAIILYVYMSSSFTDFENSSNRIPIYIGVFIVFTGVTLLLERKQKVFK